MGGIFGLALKKNCSEKLFYGTDYHSHLATEFGGLAVSNERIQDPRIHNIRNSQFKSRFFDEHIKMVGNRGIGVISHERQPLKIISHLGEFAICTNGLINNSDELVNYFLQKKISFSENDKINQTELVGKLICEETTYVKGLENMFDKINGSISVLLLTNEGLYAASDRFPLVIGKGENGLAVTSETAAFPNLDFKILKYLQPKEIVFFDENEIKSRANVDSNLKKICAFLWIYTGFPTSNFENINVEIAREMCGKCLAKNDNVNADFVTGVPDSGIAHAIGYAAATNIPFRRPLQKYTPGWGRSYIPPNQNERDLIAHYKIIPIPEMFNNMEIVIVEDSIVRGTQLKKLLKEKVRPYGPKSIHIRSACPPLIFPCKFNVSTRTKSELAAREAIKRIEGKDIKCMSKYLNENSGKYKKMVDLIRQKIGATSLQYQKLEDMISAIGLPKEDLCLHCWTGKD